MQPEETYVKVIIREFNKKLSSWGHSDTWTNNQFKVLEDLIYDKSHIRIHANTLKRFFQEHTPNPQLSTRNALCIFLGYAGYNDFVMRKTEQSRPVDVAPPSSESVEGGLQSEPLPAESSAVEAKPAEVAGPNAPKRPSRWLWVAVALLLIGVAAAFAWFGRGAEIEAAPDDVSLSVSVDKGVSPLTVTMEYDVPESILPGTTIEVMEANGDVVVSPLATAKGKKYATFVYPGLGYVRLKQGDKVLKELPIESRRRGWQVFVSEGYSQSVKNLPVDTMRADGYLSLPVESVPQESRTDKLFVSYSYYSPDLVDGDNFTVEARVRNSAMEGGMPCYDTMLYVFSGSKMHGFALNEDGYAYFKFISGDKSFTGDRHDFSFIKYDPNEWHTLRITVKDKHTTFFLDGSTLLETTYEEPLGMVDELTLRFKGCGAVDYVRLYDASMLPVFEENF